MGSLCKAALANSCQSEILTKDEFLNFFLRFNMVWLPWLVACVGSALVEGHQSPADGMELEQNPDWDWQMQSTEPKAEMEKDINKEWEGIAKYKERVLSPDLSKAVAHSCLVTAAGG